MKTTQVKVPGQPWHNDKLITLDFPENWNVEICKIACENEKSLNRAQIRKAINNPLGTKRLSKLAKGRKEVVILFDDTTRPTKTYQYATVVLDELLKAGIHKSDIRFIIAPGSHGTYGRQLFVKKLSEQIVDEYPVYNHNPYEMVTNLGTTTYGTPVWINSEVAACDLKIGIGTVLFHRMFGFSGGGKIISPGVAGIETIRHNHGRLGGYGPGLKAHPSSGYLINDKNILRLDAEETARISGLDFKIDTVLNLERNPLEVYAGDFVQVQRAASRGTMKWHSTESPQEMDIVIANTYLRSTEPYLGLWPAQQSIKNDGTIVLIFNDPEGDINHWIFNNHGKTVGASLWSGKSRNLTKGARLIIFSPYKFKTLQQRLGPPETTTWCKTWQDTIEEVQKHHGTGSKVAVLSDATSGIPQIYQQNLAS